MLGGLPLAHQVYAVVADDRAVFLDVGSDRYFKLGILQTKLLTDGASPARDGLVSQLIRKGLARDEDEIAVDLARTPRAECLDEARSGDVFSVVGACWWARRTLRSCRFADIVAWARAVRPTKTIRASALVSDFLARRPFYARDYNCLFDSLALTRFLRVRGQAADWVFGVRGAPFAAHCWVEVNGEPVNDEPGFVAPYTPILVL